MKSERMFDAILENGFGFAQADPLEEIVFDKILDTMLLEKIAWTEFPLQSRGAWLWVSTCKWFIAKSNRETDEENRNATTDQ